eukprot:scaffold31482_cov51-Phaeocystis_antarctica.AAC.3
MEQGRGRQTTRCAAAQQLRGKLVGFSRITRTRRSGHDRADQGYSNRSIPVGRYFPCDTV